MTELEQARKLLNEGQGLQDIMLFDWLVQQAEKAEELEKENELVKDWYTLENKRHHQKEKEFSEHIARLEEELILAKMNVVEQKV